MPFALPRLALAPAALIGLAVLGFGATTIAPGAQPVGGMSRAEAFQRADEAAALGQKMFFDVSLSASGAMSCASCHDPKHGFAAPNALPVQLGGPTLSTPGLRNVPT